MDVWTKIKNRITEGYTVGAMGYEKEVNLAADIYMLIRNDIKNINKMDKAFNLDEYVGRAICNRKIIEELLGK